MNMKNLCTSAWVHAHHTVRQFRSLPLEVQLHMVWALAVVVGLIVFKPRLMLALAMAVAVLVLAASLLYSVYCIVEYFFGNRQE